MNLYNFKNISIVPKSKDFCDIILSKTQRKTPTVVHANYNISRIRTFYIRKVKTVEQNFNDRLSKIIQEFPKIDTIHPFYSNLLNIYYDKDHYKIGLGQLNLARSIIRNIGKDYCRFIKFGDSLYRCKQLKKIAFGKMVTVIKKQKNNLEYLEQVRQHMSRLPSINPYTRTMIICGFPNVGKSSFMNTLTKANVNVEPYPFTTKSIYVGHMDYKYLRWQLIDTPGILDKRIEDRNIIEMQSITALMYLRSMILYFIDLSESCGHSIDEQIDLFNNIKVIFNDKPVVIVLSKIDLLGKIELNNKSEYINKIFKEKVENKIVPIVMISTMNNVGIEMVKEIACDSLLAHRIENKSKLNKSDSLVSKLYVAYPKIISKQRITYSNLKRIKLVEEETTTKKRKKLERDIELEKGDDYVLDLKKKYDLPEQFKYDVIPEIWEGHNIMDYIQVDVLKKLENLEEEECAREKSGFYSVPKIKEDDEMTIIKDLAKKIRETKIVNKLNSRVIKQSTKPKLSRITMPFNRQRSLFQFKNDMKKIGVIINESIKNKTKVNKKRSPSKQLKVNNNDCVEGNIEKTTKRPMLRYNVKQKKTVCESDRFIGTKRPKYLNSGKRGIGKNNRR